MFTREVTEKRKKINIILSRQSDRQIDGERKRSSVEEKIHFRFRYGTDIKGIEWKRMSEIIEKQ